MHRDDPVENRKETRAAEPGSELERESPDGSVAVRTPERDLGSSLGTVWLRLMTLGVVALVFSEALMLAPGKAQGWSYYLTSAEVLFEIVVRLVAADGAALRHDLSYVLTAIRGGALPRLWLH